jgi:hypothetical protein
MKLRGLSGSICKKPFLSIDCEEQEKLAQVRYCTYITRTDNMSLYHVIQDRKKTDLNSLVQMDLRAVILFQGTNLTLRNQGIRKKNHFAAHKPETKL